MASATTTTFLSDAPSDIAIVGAGPAGLVLAIALARRGIRSTVFERDPHPNVAPRFNPERSYTIDISGHGLRALRHIDACAFFDERLLPFKGLKLPDGRTEEWTLPGWTGSRGDILRALMAVIAEKHAPQVSFEFECRVDSVDVNAGTLTCTPHIGASMTRLFDLIVGGDGTNSIVRQALSRQVEGFTIEKRSLPNYVSMIELDCVGHRLNPAYLHGLSASPFCVAGAMKGEPGQRGARWFCAVGTRTEQVYASTQDALAFLRAHAPRVVEFASEEAVAAFAKRKCYHVGQRLTCSQLHGGKAVLLGDACGSFPPIGQGANAAMESAMVLDQCIGQAGRSPRKLLEATQLYDSRWKRELDAIAWISERALFENRFHLWRAALASKLGVSIFDRAKSAELQYSAVKRAARRVWPLWV